MVNRNSLFLTTTFIVVFLDQLTKFISKNVLETSVPVIKNVFHFTLVKNTGAGFGVLQNNTKLLIFISLIVIGFILYSYPEIIKNRKLTFSASLILGGALGNLIDRLAFSAVTDFIDFRIWPAFNIADAALVVGVILLIFHGKSKKSKK